MDPLEVTFGTADSKLVADAGEKYSVGDRVHVRTGVMDDGQEITFYGIIAKLRGRTQIGGGLMNVFRPADHPEVLRNRVVGDYGYSVDVGERGPVLIFATEDTIFPDTRTQTTS